MLIGICGKSGSGKSTLANQIIKLTNNESIHLDIDKIGHKVLTIPDVMDEIIKTFGNTIVDKNNIDRKKLGEIVFNSRHDMKKLSNLTWKYMQIEIDEFLNINKDKIIILDWLLLPSTKYFNMCNLKILLDTDYQIRKQRAIKRDNISDYEFDLREKSSIEPKAELFDYIIKNNEQKKNLKERVLP